MVLLRDKMLKVFFVGMLFVFIPIFSFADDLSIFGFYFAEPISFSECKKRDNLYDILTYEICYERMYGTSSYKKLDNEFLKIRFPSDSIPDFLKYDHVNGLIIDGNLEKITFYTKGILSQEYVLEVLTKKYGNSSVIEKKSMQNAMGATFETFDAYWNDLEKLYVKFKPTNGEINHGSVSIETLKGRLYMEKLKNEADENKIKL